ncbi:MAG TPA: YncE family protein [Oscillatoriaceae cyanobacterium]
MNRIAIGLCTAFLLALGGTALAAARDQSPDGTVFITGVLSGVQADSLKTGKLLKRFDTGDLPHNLLLSPDGKKVYVTNVGSESVSEIDVRTLTKTKDIRVGAVPRNAYHDKLGAAAYDANTCYGCHKARAVGTEPVAMAWAGDRRLLVTESHGRKLAVLDPAAGALVREVDFHLPGWSSPSNVAVDPNNHDVWVLHSFLPPDPKPGVGHTVEEAIMNREFSHAPPLGQHRSYVTVYDPSLHHELKRLSVPWSIPFGAVFSPDARRLYVAYRSSDVIAVFDTRAMRLERTFKVASSPVGIALSKDGRQLYVPCLFQHPAVEQIVDTRTGAVLVSMEVPPSPSRTTVDPRTGYLYVTATGTNKLLEIDPIKQELLRMLPAGLQPLDSVVTP